MDNVYQNFSFHWWVGVVEDRFDPLYLGRCKVRIVGHHTSDKADLPTSDLPWCYPIQDIKSAAMSGKGQTPIGPVEGTWVVGFFRDGDDCQEPVFFGTMSGIPGKSYYDKLRSSSNYGFQDPNKVYPLDDYLDESEPDTNRLARNQSIDKTIIKTKDDARETSVETAIDKETWEQPLAPYNALYPYNHVYESESGHIFEVDDTPQNERITTYHKSGTYEEIDVNGTKTTKVVGDGYEIYLRNKNVLVKGNVNITVEGNCDLYVKNDCDIEVDGNMRTHVHGDYELNVAGELDITSGKDINVYSDAEANIKTRTKLSVGSPITEVAIIKFNSFSFAPTPPSAATLIRNSVSELSPTLPTFQPLVVPNREETLTFTLDVLSEDFETNAELVQTLLNEAVSSGIITQAQLDETPSVAETDDEETPEKPEIIPGCGEINNLDTIPDTLQISNFYTIADLTTGPACSHVRLAPSVGLSEHEIACNLKALAEQVLDPIKAQYSNMLITSGFRNYVPEGGSTTSQHLRGQAVDVQFPGVSKSQYFEIAKWIKRNVNFDQMLLEYKSTGTGNPWIHLSFSRSGNRNTVSTFFNHRTAEGGRGVLLQLA